jgi:hypothetical protein
MGIGNEERAMEFRQVHVEKENRRKGAEGMHGDFSARLLFPFSPFPLFTGGAGGNPEFRIPNSEFVS